jgi:hypothetical protein
MGVGYGHGQRRKAMGLSHMSGVSIALLAMVTLPALFCGGCVLAILWQPGLGFAPK